MSRQTVYSIFGTREVLITRTIEQLAVSVLTETRSRLDNVSSVREYVAELIVQGRRSVRDIPALRALLRLSLWLGHNHLQLAFGVLNHLSGHYQAAFRGWTIFRHHEWISGVSADTVDACRTVAILLTPRHDALRPWDTTMYVLFGAIDIDEEELDSYRQIFGSTK